MIGRFRRNAPPPPPARAQSSAMSALAQRRGASPAAAAASARPAKPQGSPVTKMPAMSLVPEGPEVSSGASMRIGPDGMPEMLNESPYKQGPGPVAYKKGGSVGKASKRADGIAQRGKTKGRMI